MYFIHNFIEKAKVWHDGIKKEHKIVYNTGCATSFYAESSSLALCQKGHK